MKEYEAIILILYFDNNNLYRYNKLIWDEYINSNDKILSLFIKYDNTIDDEIKLIENQNLLLIRGEETLDPSNIFIKTIKYCHENYNYKYIIRTKISSFWVYDKLLNYLNNLQNNFIYGWKENTTLNNKQIDYISATDIIIPFKLVPMLFNHNETNYIIEDVEISQFYFRIERICDKENNDKYILDNLLSKYYNKQINVSKQKLHLLLNNDNITIFKSNKAISYSKYIVDIIELNIKKNIINTNYENNPDIIITHITEARTFFNEKSLNIIISGESRDVNQIYDIYIGTNIQTKSNINLYIPFLYLSLKDHSKSINTLDYINNKQKFCAYMYSYNIKHRVKYFNLLNSYKKVDALGNSCNNIINNYNSSGNYLDDSINIYTNYKFVLSLENFLQDGYITEKIKNPLIAGAIPIYWGPKDVFKYINKKRVIYIMDYESDKELIKRIIEIDNSYILYNEIISEPIYTNEGEPEKIFNKIEEKIKYLINI